MDLKDKIGLGGGVNELIAIPLVQRGEELIVTTVCAPAEGVEEVGSAAVGDEVRHGKTDAREMVACGRDLEASPVSDGVKS